MSNGMTGGDIDKLLKKSIFVAEAKGNSLVEDARTGRYAELVAQSLHNVDLVLANQLLQEVFMARIPLLVAR